MSELQIRREAPLISADRRDDISAFESGRRAEASHGGKPLVPDEYRSSVSAGGKIKISDFSTFARPRISLIYPSHSRVSHYTPQRRIKMGGARDVYKPSTNCHINCFLAVCIID